VPPSTRRPRPRNPLPPPSTIFSVAPSTNSGVPHPRPSRAPSGCTCGGRRDGRRSRKRKRGARLLLHAAYPLSSLVLEAIPVLANPNDNTDIDEKAWRGVACVGALTLVAGSGPGAGVYVSCDAAYPLSPYSPKISTSPRRRGVGGDRVNVRGVACAALGCEGRAPGSWLTHAHPPETTWSARCSTSMLSLSAGDGTPCGVVR
jgi:hypothetical protein